MNDIMAQALKVLGEDVAGAVRFSPAGDLAKRSMYARYGQQPEPFDQAMDAPAALRTATTAMMPEVVLPSGALGALGKATQNFMTGNEVTQDIVPAGIETARSAAMAAPVGAYLNRSMLRELPWTSIDPRLKQQTLIQNAIERLGGYLNK